jgi:succinate dehydrogenase / fumarate reductase cytochrome b subunit
VTAYPVCHVVLQAFQRKSESGMRTKSDIPVLHLQQLVGVAVGISTERLGVNGNVIALPALALASEVLRV